jgi:hypothetical protein
VRLHDRATVPEGGASVYAAERAARNRTPTYCGAMNATPGFELYILMEAAEDDFPMGGWVDFEWHRSHPGGSPTTDLVLDFERRGWVEIVQVNDTYGSNRKLARARITADGRKLMDQLLREGVQPEDPAEHDPSGAES